MTKEEIIEIANKVKLPHDYANGEPMWLDKLEEFAKLIAEKERRACAEICDGFYLSWIDIQGRYEFMGEGASECAGAIRARGQE